MIHLDRFSHHARLSVTLANGERRELTLRPSKRAGTPVLEVVDTATNGKVIWTVFELPSLPVGVELQG